MSAAQVTTEYLVSHGRSGALGRFASPQMCLRRGQRVVVESYRGLELGKVLCEATERHRQALPHAPGRVIREATAEDEVRSNDLAEICQRVLTSATHLRMAGVEVLDVEPLLDGRRIVLHYLAGAEHDIEPLLEDLSKQFGLDVFAENLAHPVSDEPHGCGKPDCGKTDGGGCTSCESGGCSSCGHGGVDMTAYFAHLRGRMEDNGRVPLV